MKLKITMSGILLLAMCANINLVSAKEHGERRESHESRERGEHQHGKATDGQRAQKDIQGHADKLYAAVKQARGDLRQLRILAGLHVHASGPHLDPKGHHANDTPEQQRRERSESPGHEDGGGEHGHKVGGERGHREGREHGQREGGERGHREGGEHGHREGGERGDSEKGGRGIAKLTKHVKTYKNGGKLTLQYNPATQAFIGNVKNTTSKDLPDMRVEIHLSNGVELGPTKRIKMKPGQTIPIELGAFGQNFTHWVTHPEAGVEEAHAPGDEENEHAGGEHGGERGGHAARERGEHGGKHSHDGVGEGGHGMGDASLSPVYNQLQLLRGEMKAFSDDIKAMKK